MPITVYARENLKKGDRVVVSGRAARQHKGGTIEKEGILATALEDINAGDHGPVEEWTPTPRK